MQIQEQGNESSTVSNSASTAEVVESKTVDDSESNKTDFDDNQNPKLENDDLSTVNKPNEGRFPQTFSQVQQGLTSLFKWKA